MLVMFILGLILIGLLALVAHSLSGLYAATNDLSSASRERQIEMIWEAEISSLFVQAGPNGEFVAPIGHPLFNETGDVIGQTLPRGIAGPRVNTKGYAPLYCALGRAPLAGGASEEVFLDSKTTYRVETTEVAGIKYVSRSTPIPGLSRGNSSVMGFIISPFEKRADLSCADITYDEQTGSYSTPGAITKIIPLYGANGGTLSAAEALNRSSSQFIDASQFSSINEALAPYLNNPPRRIVLNLPSRSSNYALTEDLSFGRSTASDAELVIVGAGGAQPIISGAYTFRIRHARMVLSNVGMEADLRSEDSTLSLAGAGLGSLTINNSTLVLDGENSLAGKMTADNSRVDQDGALGVTYNADTSGAIDIMQTSWRVRGGSVAVHGASAYGIWVDQASQMTIQNGGLSLNGSFGQGMRVGPDSVFTSIGTSIKFAGSAASFAEVKGRFIATGGSAANSGALFNGALLRDGASILLDNGQQWFSAGNAPDVGVNDAGALSVAGANAQIGGANCWQGYLFSESAAGQVTNNNNVNMQGRNTASWSCSQ